MNIAMKEANVLKVCADENLLEKLKDSNDKLD